jgi:hypothetical protein
VKCWPNFNRRNGLRPDSFFLVAARGWASHSPAPVSEWETRVDEPLTRFTPQETTPGATPQDSIPTLYPDGNPGWYPILRAETDFLLKHPHHFTLLAYLCKNAAYYDGYRDVVTGRGMTKVYLRRGQAIFGSKGAGRALGQHPRTTFARLKSLERWRIVTTQPAGHYTLVTICFLTEFWAEEEFEIHARRRILPPNYHPTTTYKQGLQRKTETLPPTPQSGEVLDVTPPPSKKKPMTKVGKRQDRGKEENPRSAEIVQHLITKIEENRKNWEVPCQPKQMQSEMTALLKERLPGEIKATIDWAVRQGFRRNFSGWLQVLAGSGNPARTLKKKYATMRNQMNAGAESYQRPGKDW